MATPQYTNPTPNRTTATDTLARKARRDHVVAVSRAQLLTALDALDSEVLSVACRVGTMRVRRVAADALHARPAEPRRCECCDRPAQPGRLLCEWHDLLQTEVA